MPTFPKMLAVAAALLAAATTSWLFLDRGDLDGAPPLPDNATTNPATGTAAAPVAPPASRTPLEQVRAAVAAPAATGTPEHAAAALMLLGARQLYEVLANRFATDRDGAAALCRQLLHQLLGDQRMDQERAGAVLAAWLDGGESAATVLASALDALVVRDGPAVPYQGTGPFELALALFTRAAGIPPLRPASRADVVAALLQASTADFASTNRGAAIAMALQSSDSEEPAVIAALLRLGRSPVREVRGSALTALGYRLSPAGLLAAFEDPAQPVRTEADWLREVGLLAALQQAAERHPLERPVLQRWLRDRLRVPPDPGGTPLQSGEMPGTAWLRSLLQQLTPADVAALRPELERLAADGSAVASQARRLLGRER